METVFFDKGFEDPPGNEMLLSKEVFGENVKTLVTALRKNTNTSWQEKPLVASDGKPFGTQYRAVFEFGNVSYDIWVAELRSDREPYMYNAYNCTYLAKDKEGDDVPEHEIQDLQDNADKFVPKAFSYEVMFGGEKFDDLPINRIPST